MKAATSVSTQTKIITSSPEIIIMLKHLCAEGSLSTQIFSETFSELPKLPSFPVASH